MLFLWKFLSLISPFRFKNLAFIFSQTFYCGHFQKSRKTGRILEWTATDLAWKCNSYFILPVFPRYPGLPPFIDLSYFSVFQSNLKKTDVVPHEIPAFGRQRLENQKFKARLHYILRPNSKQTKAVLLPMHRLNNISLTKVYYFPSFGVTCIHRTKPTSLKCTISPSV